MLASRMLRNVGSAGRGFWGDSINTRAGDNVMLYSLTGMGALCGVSYWLGYKEIGNDRRGVSETMTAFNDDTAKTLRA